MRVRIIQHFGNHFPGEICDSVKLLENGKRIDSDMDKQAFGHWIECGWAESIEDSPRRKRVSEAPANKAITG